jgi:hypothetical protein
MTPPRPIGLQPIGAMSSSRVILGELLSSRARLRFPGPPQTATATPVRQAKLSERQTGLFQSVSPKGFTPESVKDRKASLPQSGDGFGAAFFGYA